ncbi:Carboxypeptidase regulatory-like domain-containing protein [Marininema mesophilum]|uniref:Carboxypeptidase regulatory-like domain-containing protein n=1 Tax=Marininema mesophilum TaxID=1048340 RepID=A0A1H2Y182_9BACL|nr:carboxypeptidase regulatory-like domain-containing protein [Marininema mesophilum]SDW98907.1 Carboxypeptidase regulatory-like domain-containing protein [Marininema mesophilum]
MLFPDAAQFRPIPFRGSVLFDHIRDVNPKETDIVGTSQFPAAYYAYDGSNSFFRLRLNADPRLKTGFSPFSWGLLFETDGNPATYEWVLSIDGANERLVLIKNTDPKPNTWNDPAGGTNGKGAPNFSLPIINYDLARVTPADSTFDGDPDFFLDFFIPSATLFSFLGITAATQIRMLFFTATNNNNFNKDSLQTNEGFAFQDASSDLLTFNQGDVRAKLAVDKTILTGPTTITAGQITSWSEKVVVTNTGKSTANTTFVQIPLKLEQLSIVQIQSSSIGSAVFTPLTKSISWNIGNLDAGVSATLIFSFSGTIKVTGQQLIDEATVTGVDNFTGANTTQVSDQVFITVNAVPGTGNISGFILDKATGLPLTGATVTLLDVGNNPIASTVSNEGGSYGFTNVSPGSYTVTATLANYALGSSSAQVTADAGTTVNVLVPPLPATVDGTITGQGIGPLLLAEVRLIDPLGIVLDTTTTGLTGFYTFTGITPNAYTLSVSFPNFQSTTRAIILAPNETETQDFNLLANPASVFGTVTNQSTGSPIVGAQVTIIDIAGVIITTTITDGSGNYTINSLSPGAYRIQVSATGFSTIFLSLVVTLGSAQQRNISLPPNSGTLSGTITDSMTGAPLANASIKVVGPEGFTVAETLSALDGSYSVTGLQPGVYSVTFTEEGYASKTFSATIHSGQTTTLSVTLSQLAGVFSGIVQDDAGNPISGATVQVYLNDVLVASFITEANGRFFIPNISPGNYTAVAFAEGFSRVSVGMIIQPFMETIQQLILATNPGTLVGLITDTSGNPILGAGLNVRTDIATGPIIARGLTDANGRYSIPLLQPGTYVVTAVATDFQSVFSGVAIRSDQETSINLSLLPNPASIQGTVHDMNGTPITDSGNILIRVLDSGGALVTSTFSDSNGQYLIDKLAPGNYDVLVTDAGFQISGGSISLSPGEVGELNFFLPPNPGTIVGTVTSSSGTPISGATIRVTDRNGVFISSTLTDDQGSFLVNGLYPGDYNLDGLATGFQNSTIGVVILAGVTSSTPLTLQPSPGALQGTVTPQTNGALVKVYTEDNIFLFTLVTDPTGDFFIDLAPGAYILTASESGFITQRIGAVVRANETTTVEISLSPEPSSVRGRITDPDGIPVNQTVIRVIDLNETVLGTAFADSNGNYTIDGLPSGIRIIQASSPTFTNTFDTITLLPGETLSDVNLILQPNPGQINGHVNDSETGSSISGATVFLRDTEGAIIGTVTTSVFGNYIFPDLSPGNYDVIASADQYDSRIIGASVLSNTETSANITLTKLLGSISGQILGGTGTPITGNNLQVRLFDNHNQLLRSIVAQSDGTFLFDNLRPANYLINVTIPGFVQNTASAIVPPNTTTSLTITVERRPATLTGLIIEASTGQQISGAELSSSKELSEFAQSTEQLISGADLNLYTIDNVILAGTLSGSDGRFLFERLPEGSFNLTATANGFGESSIGVVLSKGETTETTINLQPNPGSMFGFATALDSGEAIPGATVRLYDSAGSFNSATVTSNQGEYLVGDLVPGTYVAIASSPGFQNQLGGAIIETNQSTRLSFSLTALPGAIEGTVINAETTQPLPEASIKVRPFNSFGVSTDTTLSSINGQYEFTELLPTNYELVYSKSEFNDVTNSGSVSQGETAIIDVALSPQRSDLLPPTPPTPPTPPEPPFPPNPVSLGAIEGTVRDRDTLEPLTSAKVVILNFNQSVLFTSQTDENGFFRFNQLGLGEYTVSASNPGYENNIVFLELTSSTTETINLLLFTNPAKIVGTVRNEQNQAFIAGATVQVLDTTGILISETVTNGQGNYSVSGIGTERVASTVSVSNFGSAAKSAALKSGETKTVDFLLSPLFGSLRGTVRDERLLPIFNVRVQIFTNPVNPPAGSGREDEPVLIRSATTSADGTYFVSNLAPGCYIGEYSFPKKETAIRRFCIQAGETTIVDVILHDGDNEEE